MKFLESLPKHNLIGKVFQKDEDILKEGDSTSDGICIVLKGSAKSDPSFKNPKSIQRVYTQGMIFGMSGLISKTSLETFQANENDTYIVFIKEEDFHKSLISDEKFLTGILQSSIDRLQRIPNSDLVQPEEPISLTDMFGEEGEKKFQSIRDKNLDLLTYLYNIRSRTVPPNDTIFKSNKLEDSDIYLLVQGSVHQYLGDPEDPKTHVPVIDLQPGALFGFLRKTENQGHYLNAKSGAAGANLVHLESDLLLKVSKLDSKLAWSILQNVILTVAVVERTMIKA